MGVAPSISKEQLANDDCHQIADRVAGLGAAYSIYRECILSNAVSGDILSEINDIDEFKEFLDDLGITNTAHKKVLSVHYKKIFLTTTTTASLVTNVVTIPSANLTIIRQDSYAKEAESPRHRPLPRLVFLTHDWGKDELNRSNHDRVKKVNRRLMAEGIKTWFDEDRLVGDIRYQMADGIENSYAMVVFVTRRYMRKVNGADGRDNCKVSLF